MNKCYYIPIKNNNIYRNNSDQKSLIYRTFLVFFYRHFYKERSPPFSNWIRIKNLIGGKTMKKFFKLFFQRYEDLIPLPCIIKNKEGGQRL